MYSEGTENNMEQPAQEATANVEREAEVAANEQPASEEVAEPAKAEASVAEQPKQPAQCAARKPKKKGLTFGNMTATHTLVFAKLVVLKALIRPKPLNLIFVILKLIKKKMKISISVI